MIRFTSIAVAAWMLVAAGGMARASGEDDYKKQCVSCHGADGKGKTKMGEKLKIKDLTDAKVQGEFTDEQAAKDVSDGIKDKTGKVLMPGKKDKLSADQIKDVVTYVRTLKGK